MAQAGYTPIQLYFSTTAAAVPLAANLAQGELAINIADGKLYYENSSGVVTLLAGAGGAGIVAGSNTQLQFNNSGVFGASSSLTWDGTTLSSTQVNITGQGTLRLQDTTGGEYVGLRSPSALGASYTLTFPADDGTSGQALITDGSGVLSWSTAASGDVYGPGSSTDNAVARFDSTTGKLLQNSVVLIGDTGAVTGVTDLTASGSVTLSGGTANGVPYLNGSKVLTTGSAITYDGTTFAVVGRLYNGSASTFNTSTWAMSLGNGGVSANYFKGATTYFQNDSGTQIAQLDSTGLGIGTNAPTQKLTVAGAINLSTDATNPNSGVALWSQAGIGATLSGFNITFNTGSNGAQSERVRITSAGLVGIGTTGPVTQLQVNSGSSYVGGFKSTIANGFVAFQDSGTSGALTDGNVAIGAISDALAFRSGGATRMRLDSAGNLGLGVTPTTGNAGKTFELGTAAGNIVRGGGLNDMNVESNIYYDSAFKYAGNGFGSRYSQNTGQHQWWIAPNNTSGAGVSATLTQAMTLDASGYLGVGTTSPSTKLDVAGGSSADVIKIRGRTSDNFGLLIFATSAGIANAYVGSTDSTNLVFYTNGFTERMRIDSSGNVGIGVTPSNKLDVNGTTFLRSTTTVYSSTGGAVNSSFLTFGSAALQSAASIYGKTDTSTAGNLVFATAQSGTGTMTERGRFDSSGNLGVGDASPVAKLDVFAGQATQLRVRGTSTRSMASVLSAFEDDTNGGRASWGSNAYTATSYSTALTRYDTTLSGWSVTGNNFNSTYTANDALQFQYVSTAGATSEYGRFDSAGSFLIGTTSSTTTATGSFTLGVSKTHIFGSASANSNSTAFSAQKTTLWIENDASATNSEYAKPALLISSYEGASSNPGPLARFYRQVSPSAPARVFEVNFLGNIGLGDTNASTSGTGITFPATQSASSNANTLDDYEEGTWTPTDGSGAGLSFTVTGAQYVKVGQMVTAIAVFQYPSTVDTATCAINGLPFNTNLNNSTGSVLSASAGAQKVIINTSGTFLLFPVNSVSQSTNATLSSATIYVSLTYRATA